MLSIDILLGGEKFRLPDDSVEKSKPILQLIHKGITYIFKPVFKQYPGHKILVIWDEDLKTLRYESDTLTNDKILEVLTDSHGNIFS
jgi:hypothetical protein